MKKTRFLALILAVVLMLMGAGYAFWTENLKIDATVKTGKLDFKFSDAKILSKSKHIEANISVKNMDDEKGNMLKLRFEDVYPGAEAEISFNMENKGTIPLKVEGFKFSGDNIEDLKIYVDSGWESIAEYVTILNEWSLEIGVGESIENELKFKIKEGADETSFPESRNFTFSITAIAKQYNDQS
ncbi:MAG TPA: hypothetical protein VFC70_04110 [Oscillospiraceae bacterium]|nr:hypothetical protein [Oscillospiraceae bacterium]